MFTVGAFSSHQVGEILALKRHCNSTARFFSTCESRLVWHLRQVNAIELLGEFKLSALYHNAYSDVFTVSRAQSATVIMVYSRILPGCDLISGVRPSDM